MQTSLPKFNHIEHTADAGIKVFASDMKTLFENAAAGLFDLITNLDKVACRDFRDVHVESTDREALLVRWLSELNYLFLTQEMIFADFEISQLNERRLLARIGGEPLDLDKHEIYTEVKAVTYHGLYIEERSNGCEAQIIFDL
ncbi:MAG: archease [bacterium]